MDSQIVNQQYVYLNSDYCEKKDNKYSCNIELQNKINVLNVISYVVPKSYFVINNSNNKLAVGYNTEPGGEPGNVVDVVLENGNYNIYEFCFELQTKIRKTAVDNGLVASIVIDKFFVSFTENQNTALNITENGNLEAQEGNIYFETIAGGPIFLTIYVETMPDIFNCVEDNIFLEPDGTKHFTGILNLDPKTIYLCCDEIKPEENYKNPDQAGESSEIHNVLEAINVQTTSFFNYISANVLFSDYKDLSQKIENTGNYNFTFYFVDDKNNVIDFNNIPFFISLEFAYKMSKIQIGELFSITDKEKTLNEENLREKFLSLENQPENDINML